MQLIVFAALLVLVPAAYGAAAPVTVTGVCRIAGTAVKSALGSVPGGQLEKGCSDTQNECSKKTGNVGIDLTKNILGNIGGFLSGLGTPAGQIAGGAVGGMACGSVATASDIATAAKGKNNDDLMKAIAKVACTPVNYAAMVTDCSKAIKEAKLPPGTDLTTATSKAALKGKCDKITYVDDLGVPCIPKAP